MGLFTGSKGPAFNPAIQQQLAQSGAQKQRELISGGFKKAAPLAGEFKQQVGEATSRAGLRRKAIAGDFLKSLGKGQKAADTQQFNLAKQQILGSIPELQRAARENAAATGGLQRGAALNALQAPVIQAGEQLGQVAGDIALQSQQKQNQAFSDIFQGDRAFELSKLGIDQNVARTLLQTGRGDILQEALKLAGVEDQLTTDLIGIDQNRQEADAARAAASANRKAALTGALLGAGGQIAGGALAGRKS